MSPITIPPIAPPAAAGSACVASFYVPFSNETYRFEAGDVTIREDNSVRIHLKRPHLPEDTTPPVINVIEKASETSVAVIRDMSGLFYTLDNRDRRNLSSALRTLAATPEVKRTLELLAAENEIQEVPWAGDDPGHEEFGWIHGVGATSQALAYAYEKMIKGSSKHVPKPTHIFYYGTRPGHMDRILMSAELSPITLLRKTDFPNLFGALEAMGVGVSEGFSQGLRWALSRNPLGFPKEMKEMREVSSALLTAVELSCPAGTLRTPPTEESIASAGNDLVMYLTSQFFSILGEPLHKSGDVGTLDETLLSLRGIYGRLFPLVGGQEAT